MKQHNYFVYIITDQNRSVLYTGVTNQLERRLFEHFSERGKSRTFAGRYFCHNLVFYERHQFINQAIMREKQTKGMKREKKIRLISEFNPDWKFLNGDIMDWPPY